MSRPRTNAPRTHRGPFLSRRSLLRGLGAGAGVALALPWLEAMSSDATAQDERAPTRFVTIFAPHGMDMPSWTPRLPAGRSRSVDFVDPAFGIDDRRVLAPLAPYRDELVVISGLGNAPANAGDFNGSHARGTGTLLTCSALRATSDIGRIENGESLDQLLARRVGGATPFASLELGVRAGELDGDCEDGYSCAYINNISWSGSASPSPKQTSPRDVFGRLVRFYMPSMPGDPPPTTPAYRPERSVLDHVRADAMRLSGIVGRDDRRRVDEYLSGVRELERRLDTFGGGGGMMGGGAVAECVAPARPEASPASYEEHVRLMLDLIAFAFRCDLTRVVTFMMENPFNSRSYAFIDVSGNSHEISHHGGDASKLERIRRIDEWQTGQVARFVGALASSTEGTDTLLDHSIVYYTSEFGDGDDHYHHDLPIVIAGRGNGAITPGRHIHYGGPVGGGLGDVSRSRPLADLYVSIQNAMGVPDTSFGDNGTRPLAELA